MLNEKLMALEDPVFTKIPKTNKDTNRYDYIYYDWLFKLIKGTYYDNLLELLHSIPFTPNEEELDYNRYLDGLRLRDRFKSETNGKIKIIKGPCTFLEMLIALAIRLDSDIMYETKFGDRSVDWFWMFIDNLGFTKYTDSIWDPDIKAEVLVKVYKILSKNYAPDGSDGLFTVKDRPDVDLRECDIWRQMIWWVDENLKKGVIE
jgi:hypothetical protein